jgi:hypothetical protein
MSSWIVGASKVRFVIWVSRAGVIPIALAASARLGISPERIIPSIR